MAVEFKYTCISHMYLTGTRLVPGPQPPIAPQSKGTSGRVKVGSSADIGCRLSMWSIVPVREAYRG